MQVYEVGGGKVITLEPGEYFRATAPDVENPEATATKVRNVTAIPAQNGKPAHYTLSGEQIHPPEGAQKFWTIDAEFTDSGPLPPHVRAEVEQIVPVQDTPDFVIGEGRKATLGVVRVGPDGETVPLKASEPDIALRQSARRAKFQLLDTDTQGDLLALKRPSDLRRLGPTHEGPALLPLVVNVRGGESR